MPPAIRPHSEIHADGPLTISWPHKSALQEARIYLCLSQKAEHPDGAMFVMWTFETHAELGLEERVKLCQDIAQEKFLRTLDGE